MTLPDRGTLSRSALVEVIAGHTGQPPRVVEQVIEGFGDVLAAALVSDTRVVIRDVLSIQRSGPNGASLVLGKRLAAVAAGERPAPVIRTGLADEREEARRAARRRKMSLAGSLT